MPIIDLNPLPSQETRADTFDDDVDVFFGKLPQFASELEKLPVVGVMAALGAEDGAGKVGHGSRTLKDKLGEMVSVKDAPFNAKGDGVTDDTAAIQAALNAGVGRFPAGVYLVSQKLSTPVSVTISAVGARKTTIKAATGFVGNSVFDLGSPTSPYTVPNVSMFDLTIDLQSQNMPALTCYGLQDGSEVARVYVMNTGKCGIRTSWSIASNGVRIMNQGLRFSNTHVIGRRDGGVMSNSAYWDLSGMYEGTLDTCKALGFDQSGATHVYMDGFRIGGVNAPGLVDADCQGVRSYNCSVGNFIGTGNRPIFFGNAFDCNADLPTIENCQGTNITFGQATATGTAADQYSAARCFVTSPRMYNPKGDALVGATKFEFSGSASQCFVRSVASGGVLTGQKLARFLGSAATCSVDVMAGNLDPAGMSAYIDFTSADPSNIVRYFTNTTTTKRQSLFAKDQLFVERMSNGTVVQHTQFYTQINLAQPQRFCKADGTQIMTINPDGTMQFNKDVMPTAAVGNPGVVWRDAANGNALKLI